MCKIKMTVGEREKEYDDHIHQEIETHVTYCDRSVPMAKCLREYNNNLKKCRPVVKITLFYVLNLN